MLKIAYLELLSLRYAYCYQKILNWVNIFSSFATKMDFFRISINLFDLENCVTAVIYSPTYVLQEAVFMFSMQCKCAEIWWVKVKSVRLLDYLWSVPKFKIYGLNTCCKTMFENHYESPVSTQFICSESATLPLTLVVWLYGEHYYFAKMQTENANGN